MMAGPFVTYANVSEWHNAQCECVAALCRLWHILWPYANCGAMPNVSARQPYADCGDAHIAPALLHKGPHASGCVHHLLFKKPVCALKEWCRCLLARMLRHCVCGIAASLGRRECDHPRLFLRCHRHRNTDRLSLYSIGFFWPKMQLVQHSMACVCACLSLQREYCVCVSICWGHAVVVSV
jgi:hypothetical protein